jgi:gluconate 2-dehydrogenase gamma chain
MAEVSRRRFVQAVSLSPLVTLLPRGLIANALAAPASAGFAFFDAHQAAVITEATARLIPGPADDPLEAGHPGAREANVVRYIDVLLGAFTFRPPRIYAGGPYSGRAGGEDSFEDFVPLTPYQEATWRKRIEGLQAAYRKGIAKLDENTGGDYTAASGDEQDQALAGDKDFLAILFPHAIEGFLAAPEYGGNKDLVGWNEISFPGDSQPRGYTPAQIGESDGLDPVVPDVLVNALIANFEVAARAIAARRRGGR